MRSRGQAIDVAEASGDVTPAGGTPNDSAGALDLVSTLCRLLDEEPVSYCHWKSNEAIDRSASGDNDLDLLVHRPDSARFEQILRRLGFREAQPPGWKRLPGVYHAYGVDAPTGRRVHIHAHDREYRLRARIWLDP